MLRWNTSQRWANAESDEIKSLKNVLRKLLTVAKSSDILIKSLKGDRIKQKATTKVERKEMVFENWTENKKYI